MIRAGSTNRSTDAATLIAAEFTHPTLYGAALLSRWRGCAEFTSAPLAKRNATAAALVAAVFARTANGLVARLAGTEILRALSSRGHAQAATLWTAFGSFETEHRGARIDVLGHADARAIRSSRVRIAPIDRIDAFIPQRARNSRDSAAHAARFSDLSPGASARQQWGHGPNHEGGKHPPPRALLRHKPGPLVKSGVVQSQFSLTISFWSVLHSWNARRRSSGTVTSSTPQLRFCLKVKSPSKVTVMSI